MGHTGYAEAVKDCVYVSHQLCSLDLVPVIFSSCIHFIWFWLRKLIKSYFYNDI